jgi:hypothetical protein
MLNMVALFLLLTGMKGALVPFSYLVTLINVSLHTCFNYFCK